MNKFFESLRAKLAVALFAAAMLFVVTGTIVVKPAFADETVNYIESYNLSLSDDLTVNFYADEAIGKNAYLKVSIDGTDGEKTVYACEDNSYKFACTDLAPQLMSKTITATIYNAAGEEKGTKQTTLADYCKSVIDAGAQGNGMGVKEFKNLTTLIVDLLDYGAEAQNFVGDTSEKCNAFLSDAEYSSLTGGKYDFSATDSFASSVIDEKTAENVKPTTAKLYLDYNVVAKIRFEVKGLKIDGVKAAMDEKTIEAGLSSKATENEQVTEYTASVPVSVLDIGKTLSVTLTSGGNEVGYKVSGSIEGYLAKRNSAADASDKTLAEKLFNYAKSADKFDNSGTVDIILFAGQSNMVGRETEKYEQAIPEGMAYEYKLNTNELTAVQNPVGENIAVGSNPKVVEVSSGSSIVPAFVAKYVAETGRKVIVVHTARGGQPISKFDVDQSIYNVITEKYGKAVEYVEENTEFDIGRKFYVMFQGESDTGTGDLPSNITNAYKKTYMSFHNGIKNALGFQFGSIIMTSRDMTDYPAGILAVNNAHKQLAEENDDIILASSCAAGFLDDYADKYLRADKVHYNTAGLKAIAEETVTSILNYLGYGETSKAGVDPVTYLEDCYPEYTLTLANATFADGTNEKTVKVGEISNNILSGVVGTGENASKKVNAFVNGAGKYVSRSEYYMGRCAETLTAATYETSESSKYGNIDIGFYRYASYAAQGYGVKLSRLDSIIENGKYMRVYETSGKGSGGDGTGTNASLRLFSDTANGIVKYTFVNLGTNDMNFELYMRTGSSDKSDVNAVSVTVPVGETVVAYNKTTTHLTYIRFADESLSYKFAVYAETVASMPHKVTLSDGLTFTETGSKTALLYKGDTLPEITVENPELFVGVTDGTSVRVKDIETYVMPDEDVTLEAQYLESAYVRSGDGKVDYGRYIDVTPNTYTAQPYAGKAIDGGYVVIDDQIGRMFFVTATAGATSSADKTKTNATYRNYMPYSRQAGVKYLITLTYMNMSETDITFDVYPRIAGDDTAELDTILTVTLNAGEVKTVSFEWVSRSTHQMIMLYYRFQTTVTNLPLATSAYVEIATPKYTATVNGGVFEDGTNEKQFKEGAVIGGVVFENGTPYAISMTAEDGTVTAGKYGEATMPAYDVTVAPVYYNPVTAGSGDIDWSAASVQNYGIAPPITGKYVIESGKVGAVVTASGAKGNRFRLMTAYKKNSGTAYTMTYTFKNVGESAITFKYNQVNSQSDTSDNIGGETTLAAGEAKEVTLTFATAWGYNTNVMCLFEIIDESGWNNAKLFISSTIVKS